VISLKQRIDLLSQATLFDFQIAQNAVAGEQHLRGADRKLYVTKGLLEILGQINSLRESKYQADLDRTISGSLSIRP
jgi:hypothetical protein